MGSTINEEEREQAMAGVDDIQKMQENGCFYYDLGDLRGPRPLAT